MDRRPEHIDAGYRVVYSPLKIRWFSLIWWLLCVSAGALAIYQSNDRAERVVMAFGVALIGPMLRLLDQLPRKVSPQEAELMRSRLLDPPGTIWRARGGRRGRE